MDKYLLDTNAFFEMLSYIAGKSVRKDGYDFGNIKNGECYISKITELEIISVVGKYGRGEQAQWQKCNRMINEDGTVCNHNFFSKGQKPWNKKLCRDILKLTKEILEGKNTLLKVEVLELNEQVINRAESFMMHSAKYKFGSQDALIAATALVYSNETDYFQVVTSDKGLRSAMQAEGMKFVVPSSQSMGEGVEMQNK